MTATPFIVATAGHVDHGKSALVKALTGTDPSRLPQEKARGITIDLGFAQLTLPADGSEFSIGVIDVPGHEDFVKNMVAGVGSIDLALLVVAADDGWMPQTEEHLHILTYLGVPRAVVALTKCDLADAEAAGKALRQQLQESNYADAPIVPTSCVAGLGLDQLRSCLTQELSKLPPRRDIGKPRLAVDRAFSLRGLGTVVTGTLSGGKFLVGDTVMARPCDTPLRVRRIQNHHHEVAEISSGQRAALNLPEASVQHRVGDGGLARGQVITRTDAGEPRRMVDVLLTRLARLPADAPPLRHGERLRLHHGSGSSEARVYLKDSGVLLPGASVVAQVRMDSPMLVFAGDRCVLRDASARHTLAGALVLDPEASAPGFRTEAQQLLLAARARAPMDAGVFVRTQLARHRVVPRGTLLAKSGFSIREVEDAVGECLAQGELVGHGDFLAEAGWWRNLFTAAAALIDLEHRNHPDLPGLDLGRLESALGSEVKVPRVFESLVADLCANGFGKVKHAIQRQSHRAALPPPLRAAGGRLLAALALRPFDPPSRSELAPDLPSQQALRFFREAGRIIELDSEVVLSASAYAKMKETLAAFIQQQGPAKVSDLRTCLGSSRRVMIPFLERCDREGFTRRSGDVRTLGSARKT